MRDHVSERPRRQGPRVLPLLAFHARALVLHVFPGTFLYMCMYEYIYPYMYICIYVSGILAIFIRGPIPSHAQVLARAAFVRQVEVAVGERCILAVRFHTQVRARLVTAASTALAGDCLSWPSRQAHTCGCGSGVWHR